MKPWEPKNHKPAANEVCDPNFISPKNISPKVSGTPKIERFRASNTLCLAVLGVILGTGFLFMNVIIFHKPEVFLVCGRLICLPGTSWANHGKNPEPKINLFL